MAGLRLAVFRPSLRRSCLFGKWPTCSGSSKSGRSTCFRGRPPFRARGRLRIWPRRALKALGVGALEKRITALETRATIGRVA